MVAMTDEKLERCDHCGRVPSINIPTSLCHECRDGVKRAEKAEADNKRLRDALQYLLTAVEQQACWEYAQENARKALAGDYPEGEWTKR